MAFDGSGNLYVANTGSVTVYAPNSTSVLRTISQGVKSPTALTVDPSGKLYVANAGHAYYPGRVRVYAAGGSSVLRTISQGVNNPEDLAIDSGDLYVANAGDYLPPAPSIVTVYALGKSAVLRFISQGIAYPGGMAFDPSGNLFVFERGRRRRHGLRPANDERAAQDLPRYRYSRQAGIRRSRQSLRAQPRQQHRYGLRCGERRRASDDLAGRKRALCAGNRTVDLRWIERSAENRTFRAIASFAVTSFGFGRRVGRQLVEYALEFFVKDRAGRRWCVRARKAQPLGDH